MIRRRDELIEAGEKTITVNIMCSFSQELIEWLCIAFGVMTAYERC